MKRPAKHTGAPARMPRKPAPAQVCGQALLESLIVILITGIVLFGGLQIAIIYTGRDVLHHAAARAARARAVGFNDWMAFKAMRVASIPTSGQMIAPDFEPVNPYPWYGLNHTPGEAFSWAFRRRPRPDERAQFERLRIPFYLAAENHGQADFELNYEEWARGSFADNESGSMFGGGVIRKNISQNFPLQMPFAPFFFPFAPTDENGDRRIVIEGEGVAGEHSSLYLR